MPMQLHRRVHNRIIHFRLQLLVLYVDCSDLEELHFLRGKDFVVEVVWVLLLVRLHLHLSPVHPFNIH